MVNKCVYTALTTYIHTHTERVPRVYTHVLTQHILTYIAQVYMLCTVYSHTNIKHWYFICVQYRHTKYFYVNTIQLYEHLHSRKESAAKI